MTDQRVTNASLANTAPDFNLTGYSMGQLRTANKRHNRAIAALRARTASAKAAPAKAAPKEKSARKKAAV